jgi:hypothetical protein
MSVALSALACLDLYGWVPALAGIGYDAPETTKGPLGPFSERLR